MTVTLILTVLSLIQVCIKLPIVQENVSFFIFKGLFFYFRLFFAIIMSFLAEHKTAHTLFARTRTARRKAELVHYTLRRVVVVSYGEMMIIDFMGCCEEEK